MERKLLLAHIHEEPLADGRSCRTLSAENAAVLVRLTGAGLREVELAACREGAMPRRYVRNLGSFGPEDQARLLESAVAIIGLGGLGGHLAEHMARLGVGRLTLIDGDSVAESNLNRQLVSEMNTLDNPKSLAARKRVWDVNPAVEVDARQVFADENNLPELLSGVNLVLDGLDHVPSRFLLERRCRELNLPLVHGALSGLAGQVMTIFPGDAGLEALYGPEGADKARAGSVLTMTAAAVASVQAAEALKILLGWDGLLRNEVLLMDLGQGLFQRVRLG